VDSVAGAFAAIEGTEIVNAARARAYLLAGYGPPGLKVEGDCDCPEDQLRVLIGCDDEPYSTPTDDLAPWFDAAIPESADFAGFFPIAFEGLESTYTREVIDTINGGVLGRLRAAPRTLIWQGYLFGRTCCSVAHGLRWLTSILRQARCGSECGGEKLDILVCCPPEAVSDTALDCGCGVLDPVGIPADNDAFRTLYNVGLVEGPLVKSQRKAAGRCGCSTIMEIEFSMVAGNPHIYRAPVLLADCETFAVGECPEWLVVSDPAECPAPEPGVPIDCPDTTAAVATDPNCPTPTLPPVFTVDESCFCDPFAPVSLCVSVPASTYGFDFQGAPVFTIYSGSDVLRSTTIRLVENPLSLDCADITTDPCNFCEFITIRYLPAFSTLTIDGVNRRVTIETPGGDIQSGEQFMVGNYNWPLLECIDYCVCATVDGATAAADACFSMSVYPQEM
jgi:hypothetical protein